MTSVGAYDWSGGFQGYSSSGQPKFPQEKQFVDPDSYLGKKHFLIYKIKDLQLIFSTMGQCHNVFQMLELDPSGFEQQQCQINMELGPIATAELLQCH